MESSSDEPKTLFVAGCARSGTTALTRLLNSHPDIFVGTELFRSEFSKESDEFTQNLLWTERYRAKVTDKKGAHNNLHYHGDKFPGYYNNYDFLFDRFSEAKVLFIFRNIFDVAQSYKARKIHPTNPWKKGVRRAVKEWNDSLKLTIDHISIGRNITPLCYEQILFKPSNVFYDILELNASEKFDSYYRKTIRNAAILDSKRVNILDSDEKLWIIRNSRFDLYNRLYDLMMEKKL